ncbi:MAG TPA: tetratricopeptide repeat protein, partial [Candidatus Krumholzibacterium sp.]|nr:tetratricopeptide repeat protein [Candidatus Krumholzibacterium sp.]
GPQVFFENEMLATGWAAFWMIALVYLLIRCEKGWGWGGFLMTGIVSGLAVLTRPTFLPAAVFSVIIILWRTRTAVDRKRMKVLRSVSITGGLAAVLLAVAMLSYSSNGHFSPFPRSGSLNLYIGNNPDRDRTMMIRPGAEWKRLIREPRAHGYEDDAGYSRYFLDRFRMYVATQPGSFVVGLFEKTLHLVSSRELPRNVDVYSGRDDSVLMSLLVWKSGAFGFPFGIIFPLSLVGLLFRMRHRPVFLWIVPILYSASLVLVFIASRYRTALIPVLAIAAAAGAIHLVETLKSGSIRERVLIVSLVMVTVAISTLPGPFAVEDFDYNAEKYASIGYEMSRAGRLEEAEAQIRRSIELQPRYAAGQRMLGNVLNQAGRPAEAEKHFRISLEEEPESYMTHFYLALALMRQDRHGEAEVHLGRARAGAVASRDEASLRQIERISAMIKREKDDDRH